MAEKSTLDEKNYALSIKNKRLELQNEKLKKMLSRSQEEEKHLHKTCEKYCALLQEMHSDSSASSEATNKDGEIELYEEELAESRANLEKVTDDMIKAEKKVKQLTERERDYKEKLGVREDESHENIAFIIDELKSKNKKLYNEKKTLHDMLREIEREKTKIEEDMTRMKTEKETLEFEMRQQDMVIKRMQRDIRVAPIMTKKKSKPISSQGKKKPVKQGSSLRGGLMDLTIERHRCMFCGTEFVPAENTTPCTLHYGLLIDNQWTCCKEKLGRNKGCYDVQHFYMQTDDDRKIHLTDGNRRVMVSYR